MRSNDGRAVPTFINQALAGKPITVAGDGSQVRSIQYVDDLVAGCVSLLHSAHAGPVNIGNPHEITIRGLAVLIRDVVGSTSEIVYVGRPEDDPTKRRPDIALARAMLGWEVTVDLGKGLKKTIDGFATSLARQAIPYQPNLISLISN